MRHLVLLVALLSSSLTGPLSRPLLPERPGVTVPAPKREPAKYRTTAQTRFWVDGKEVTEKEFLGYDGLTVEELVVDGDEVKELRARTKK